MSVPNVFEHPKFSKLDKIESRYGIVLDKSSVDFRPVLKNQIVDYFPGIKSKNDIQEAIKARYPAFFKGRNKLGSKEIKQCHWDKGLVLIENEEFYKTNKSADSNLNDLIYADDGTNGGYSNSSTGGSSDISEKEWTGIKCGNRDHKVRKSVKQLRKEHRNRLEDIKQNKDKVKIGVVDFGIKDYHHRIIDWIISKRNKKVRTYEYNVLTNMCVANSFAVCCQIARALKEGMQILNISMGYYALRGSPIVQSFLQQARCKKMIVVFSAGNSDNHNNIQEHWSSNFAYYPSLDNVFCVGALSYDKSDDHWAVAPYSNYGETNTVHYYCQGTHRLPYRISPKWYYRRKKYWMNECHGTSFAAPVFVRNLADHIYRNGNNLSIITNAGLINKDLIDMHLRVYYADLIISGFNPIYNIRLNV